MKWLLSVFLVTLLVGFNFAEPIDQGMCICPMNYDPLCGSDAISYSNRCLFDCELAKQKARGVNTLTIVKSGPCDDLWIYSVLIK